MLSKSNYLFFFSILMPLFSNASAYWLELHGSGKINKAVDVELIYGNIDDMGFRHRHQGRELELAGDFRFTLIAPDGENIALKLTKKVDCWQFSFIPKLQGTYQLIGINDTHPVIDRSKTGGENVLPIDYLCSQYQVGKELTPFVPRQFLDIGIVKQKKSIAVTVYQDQELAKPGTHLRVFNPDNWEKDLVTNEQSQVNFSAPQTGMYIIRQDFSKKKDGNYMGVNYTSVRYRCNYCLFIVE